MAIAGIERVSGRTDVSWPDFLDFQKNCKLFDAFVRTASLGTTLSIGDRAPENREAASYPPIISMP